MEEWKTYRLGDVVRIGSGLAYKADYLGHGDALLLGMGCVSFTEKFLKKGARPYCGESDERFRVNPGDIVLATRQQSDNLPILGMPAIIPEEYRGKRVIAGSNLYVVQNESEIDNRYLYWLLKTPQYISHISSCKTGTTVRMITKKDVESFVFKCPGKELRSKIADLLWSIEDKIDINIRINHNLEEQAQALFKSWFVDFEPFKGSDFVDSELGLIPEGWRVGTLSELGDIVAGGTPSKTKPEYYTNNGIAWLTPKDLSVKCNKFTARGEIDITEDGYKNSSAKLMPRGSVLFSSRAPIGYISIAKGDICTNQGFKSVVPTYAGTAYLYYWLCENTEAIEAQASGSTFKEASGSLMRSFPALVPEKSVIDSFEKELSPILNEQEILEEEINHAEQIRDSLLPRLMSGELVMNC